MSGFALPTVLIASIVMLAVLLGAVVSTSAVRVSLNSQYYEQLNKTANEAGLAYAKACLDASNGFVNWSDDKPLKPNTDCSGEPIDGADGYIVSINDNKIRSSFEIRYPSTNESSRKEISVNATTDLYKALGGDLPWRSYNQVARLSRNYQTTREITSGYSHSCTISNDKAYCWGNNNFSQLGDGSTTKSLVPIAVGGVLAGKVIKSISAGSYHTCALDNSGIVYCWGFNIYSQVGNPLDSRMSSPEPIAVGGVLAGKVIKSISAGGFHTCALDELGKVYCWGNNINGQIGSGSPTPQIINSPSLVAGSLSSLSVSSVSAGGSHTCAIASKKVYCWGANVYNQIGSGSTSPSIIPSSNIVTGLSSLNISLVSSGGNHTCALDELGSIYCWGYNYYGQIGSGSLMPTIVLAPTKVLGPLGSLVVGYISTGSFNTCAIVSNKAYCWGYNNDGQIGNTFNTPINNPSPIAVDTTGVLFNKDIYSISSGGNSSCAVDADVKAYCWGSNDSGQLGVEGIINSLRPIYVPINNVTDITF